MDNRRTTIVINKKFQYQHSLLIAALSVLLFNGFLILQMLQPGDSGLVFTSQLTTWIGLVELVLIGGIWYGSLKVSHRIAGPVFVFAREIERLGNGDLQASVALRDNDMFQPEAQQINQSILMLTSKIKAIKSISADLGTAQGASDEIRTLVGQLEHQLSEFKTGDEGADQ
jgi:methyl-accepting chemotaxis protein